MHSQRFVAPPESIADLARAQRSWHLVRGQILAQLPPATRPLELPFELPAPPIRPRSRSRARWAQSLYVVAKLSLKRLSTDLR